MLLTVKQKTDKQTNQQTDKPTSMKTLPPHKGNNNNNNNNNNNASSTVGAGASCGIRRAILLHLALLGLRCSSLCSRRAAMMSLL